MLIILKAYWHHFQFNCSGHLTVVVASGGGFFLACENYGGRLDESIPCMCFSFFQWRSAHTSCTLGQDQSTVAQKIETTVDEHSLMSCVWVCFPDGSQIPDGSQSIPQQHTQPIQTLQWCSQWKQRIYICQLTLTFLHPHAATGLVNVPIGTIQWHIQSKFKSHDQYSQKFNTI